MTKILYLSSFSSTGYGQSAIGNVLSMVSVGLDVVCRQIKIGESLTDNSIILNLLNKDASECDTVITHCLPTYFDYSGHFRKNIGMFAYETNVISKDWVRRIKCMDEIWVINQHMKKLIGSVPKHPPIYVIPHAVDLNRFIKTFNGEGIAKKLKRETDAHIFYNIGEFVSRKNHEDLIRAYLSEFSLTDNTILLIKIWKTGLKAEQCKQRFIELINYVKQGLRLKYYPRIEIVADYWTNEEIDRLHHEADTYISCSHGEAWDQPAIDSVGFLSTPIVSECTGYLDWLQMNNGFLIEGQETPCFGANDSLDSLYTGHDTWFQPSITHMQSIMRKVYNNEGGCINNRKKHSLKTLEKFSYERIGHIIKKTLENT